MKQSVELRPTLLLAGLLLIIGAAYVPGLGGAFLFDDYPNLSGLASIQAEPDAYTVTQFVLSGPASELGRPLSLLSFALQAGSWDQRPQDFIAINIALHLLNGVLAYALLAALAAAGALPQSRRHALMATALWLVLPIHASAVLYVVQRMAVLSTTFVLAGMLLYVQGRLAAARDPVAGAVRMAAGVFVGTVLGTLCKETAAVTPWLLLAMEATVLAALPRPNTGNRFRIALLWVPALALAGYLAWNLPQFVAGYGIRTFSMSERLLTEARVLFIYLAAAFLPAHGGVRIFYDDLPLSTGWLEPWTTLAAVAGWMFLVVAAIRVRRRRPVLALAVAWYLIAHVLESGFIPLEIAFTHRSYLPLLGAALGIAAVVFEAVESVRPTLRRALALGAGAYLAVLLAGLWRATSLWADPAAQAREWLRLQPQSTRAVLAYGSQLLKHQDLDTPFRLYATAWARRPGDAVLALAVFELACYSQDIHPPLAVMRDTLSGYRGGEPTLAVGTVQNIVRHRENGTCPHHSTGDVLTLIDTMLASEGFASKRVPLYHASAMLLDDAGDKAAALERIEKAIALDPQVPLLQQAVLWSVQLGDLHRAHANLEIAEHSPRIGPRRRWLFRREIAGSRQLVALYESLPAR